MNPSENIEEGDSLHTAFSSGNSQNQNGKLEPLAGFTLDQVEGGAFQEVLPRRKNLPSMNLDSSSMCTPTQKAMAPGTVVLPGGFVHKIQYTEPHGAVLDSEPPVYMFDDKRRHSKPEFSSYHGQHTSHGTVPQYILYGQNQRSVLQQTHGQNDWTVPQNSYYGQTFGMVPQQRHHETFPEYTLRCQQYHGPVPQQTHYYRYHGSLPLFLQQTHHGQHHVPVPQQTYHGQYRGPVPHHTFHGQAFSATRPFADGQLPHQQVMENMQPVPVDGHQMGSTRVIGHSPGACLMGHSSMLPGQSGHAEQRSTQPDCAVTPVETDKMSLLRLSQIPEANHITEVPMETKSICDIKTRTILDVRLMLDDGITPTVRDTASQFMEQTYSQLGQRTYSVPQRSAVSQHNPDKALVRTREGQYRVCLALEQLSIHNGENMFILGDYHHESFLRRLQPSTVHVEDELVMVDMLTGLNKERLFGDFDFLIFHRRLGLILLGLCSLNSNSDVQYILKRVQKARLQLEKSFTVAQKILETLGISCPVTKVFCTPNLRRSFLSRVALRDKQTDKALATMSLLTSDELPPQFHGQWQSQEMFHVFLDWWNNIKAASSVACLSYEEFTVLIGCFMCPLLSNVSFDQTTPPAPSEVRQVVVVDSSGAHSSGAISSRPVETSHDAKSSQQSQFDVSALNLSIGSITKSFSTYMEEYVDLYYPDFWTETYRVPPIHFNIQKIEKRGSYHVLDMPMSKDTRGDEGENRVVSAIEILGQKYEQAKPMFIICDFQYNNYLNKLKENMFVKGEERRPKRAYGQSVRAQHDCLLIHRRHGIIIISVKAVGDNFGEWAISGQDQWTAVKRTLGKVLRQLPREEGMVRMVLGDLTDHLPCIKLVALPNLTRQDVSTAIADDEALTQEIEMMFPGNGVNAFLCKDELCEPGQNIWEMVEERDDFYDRMCDWWDKVIGKGTEDVLPEELYKQIIGRFCGLLSTVEVWSTQSPRVEVRNQAEAVQETAERFSQVLLTPQQLNILNSESKRLYLHGPPGTGKTMMLMLRAQRWAVDKGHVTILNLHSGSAGLPLGHLLHKQIEKLISRADGGQGSRAKQPIPSHGSSSHSTPEVSLIQRLDIDVSRFDTDNPGKLKDIPHGAFIVLDEMKNSYLDALSWVLANRSPGAVWCAGNLKQYHPLKFGFEAVELNSILRCPPNVQRVLQHASKQLGSIAKETRGRQLLEHRHNYLTSSAPHGLSTDGPRPWLIFHRHDGLPSDHLPLDCSECGRELADFFTYGLHLRNSAADQAKRLKLGPLPASAQSLSLKDVVIVSRQAEPCAFITALKKRHFPVTILTDTANPAVAVPTHEAITFTTSFAMTGLERKVVVYLPFEIKGLSLEENKEGGRSGESCHEEQTMMCVNPSNADQQQEDRGTEGQFQGKFDSLEERVSKPPSIGDKGEEKQPSQGQDQEAGNNWKMRRTKFFRMRTKQRHLKDLWLQRTIQQLTAEDQISLWYTASRCMGQLVIVVP